MHSSSAAVWQSQLEECYPPYNDQLYFDMYFNRTPYTQGHTQMFPLIIITLGSL